MALRQQCRARPRAGPGLARPGSSSGSGRWAPTSISSSWATTRRCWSTPAGASTTSRPVGAAFARTACWPGSTARRVGRSRSTRRPSPWWHSRCMPGGRPGGASTPPSSTRSGPRATTGRSTISTPGGGRVPPSGPRLCRDRAGSAVRPDPVPEGVRLDLGGIGKGRAADLVAKDLVRAGVRSAVVNLGGDLCIAGPPLDQPLVVAIAIPSPCTGSPRWWPSARARWPPVRGRAGPGPSTGRRRHHLIDPTTGRSARSGLAAVTVLAADAVRAEVLAKAAFVAGIDEGAGLLEAAGTPACSSTTTVGTASSAASRTTGRERAVLVVRGAGLRPRGLGPRRRFGPVGRGPGHRALGDKPKAPWLLDLHRHLGGLTVLFTGLHMAALVADSYAQFGLADLLVPFASEWRPGAVAGVCWPSGCSSAWR